MEHLTADGGAPPESPAGAAEPDPEMDRALARAIRLLIAESQDDS